jgi:hypothetical protein
VENAKACQRSLERHCQVYPDECKAFLPQPENTEPVVKLGSDKEVEEGQLSRRAISSMSAANCAIPIADRKTSPGCQKTTESACEEAGCCWQRFPAPSTTESCFNQNGSASSQDLSFLKSFSPTEFHVQILADPSFEKYVEILTLSNSDPFMVSSLTFFCLADLLIACPTT